MFRSAVLGGMWGWQDGGPKSEANTTGYGNCRIPPPFLNGVPALFCEFQEKDGIKMRLIAAVTQARRAMAQQQLHGSPQQYSFLPQVRATLEWLSHSTTILGRSRQGNEARFSSVGHVLTRNRHGHTVCGLGLGRQVSDGRECGLIGQASCGASGSMGSWPESDHRRSFKGTTSNSTVDRCTAYHGARGLWLDSSVGIV